MQDVILIHFSLQKKHMPTVENLENSQQWKSKLKGSIWFVFSVNPSLSVCVVCVCVCVCVSVYVWHVWMCDVWYVCVCVVCVIRVWGGGF
jgi:hypothetical protein